MTRKCCICDTEIKFGYNYLCSTCWNTYKDSIEEPWLAFLISMEQKERYYQEVSYNTLSLEDLHE